MYGAKRTGAIPKLAGSCSRAGVGGTALRRGGAPWAGEGYGRRRLGCIKFPQGPGALALAVGNCKTAAYAAGPYKASAVGNGSHASTAKSIDLVKPASQCEG